VSACTWPSAAHETMVLSPVSGMLRACRGQKPGTSGEEAMLLYGEPWSEIPYGTVRNSCL